MQADNNDAKLIEFCAFILSNEGDTMNAEQYWQKFSDALNRKIEVTITHDFPQAILTKEEGRRIAMAMEIAEKRHRERVLKFRWNSLSRILD